MTALHAVPVAIESYLAGAFASGGGEGTSLVDPSSGEVIATASSAGLDLRAALAYARGIGRTALGRLSFAERAALLGSVADVLQARRDDWNAIAQRNSGNTPRDAAIDVDGAIGTLKYYAKIGAALGAATLLGDGDAQRLARDPNFVGVHVGVPLAGVAIHINAYNFPAWGLWEKAAVAILAGAPVFAKPATATALLAAEMVRAVIDAQVLPEGALSLLAGSVGDLLDHVELGDVIAFTGSAETGERIRLHPHVRATGVRVNVEADSVNAALLAPATAVASPAFAAFVREVVREMTSKSGQKCTAIRRAIVPNAIKDAVVEAIARSLSDVVVGDPGAEGVSMGPVVSAGQRTAIEAGIEALSRSTRIAFRRSDLAGEAFVSPTLLVAQDDDAIVHEIEVFGPVATVIGYDDAAHAYALAARGGGSLAISVFSDDAAFLADAAVVLGATHGRVLLVDPSVAESHTGHGIVLPSCTHGGPGRAGGGEELGGLRGLWFYHQRVAMQGPAAVVDTIVQRTKPALA